MSQDLSVRIRLRKAPWIHFIICDRISHFPGRQWSPESTQHWRRVESIYEEGGHRRVAGTDSQDFYHVMTTPSHELQPRVHLLNCDTRVVIPKTGKIVRVYSGNQTRKFLTNQEQDCLDRVQWRLISEKKPLRSGSSVVLKKKSAKCSGQLKTTFH